MNRYQPLVEQAEALERLHLFGVITGGALRHMHAQRQALIPDTRTFEPRLETQRMDTADACQPQREAALEVRLPRIVVDHGRNTAEEVLETADEERVPAVYRPASLDHFGPAVVDIATPSICVPVRRRAEAGIVVPVQMVVRVDQPRPQLAGP